MGFSGQWRRFRVGDLERGSIWLDVLSFHRVAKAMDIHRGEVVLRMVYITCHIFSVPWLHYEPFSQVRLCSKDLGFLESNIVGGVFSTFSDSAAYSVECCDVILMFDSFFSIFGFPDVHCRTVGTADFVDDTLSFFFWWTFVWLRKEDIQSVYWFVCDIEAFFFQFPYLVGVTFKVVISSPNQTGNSVKLFSLPYWRTSKGCRPCCQIIQQL